MKKTLSIFLLSTLLCNLLAIFYWSFSNNEFNFNNSHINFVTQHYFNKKELKKIQQRKLINFIIQKKKQKLLNNSNSVNLNNEKFAHSLKSASRDISNKSVKQRSYCIFKKRWCEYWKIYICQQDWKNSWKIINKVFSNGVRFAKLGKIITIDLIPLLIMQNQLIKVSIVTIVAIILKLIEEGFTMVCSTIENNKLATQVIIKFWMVVPFWVSFQ